MKRQSGFQKSVDQIFEKLAVFLFDRNSLETPNFYSGFGLVSVIYSTIRKMGNKDNSRMNLEKTAVVLKSILAGEYFGVEI